MHTLSSTLQPNQRLSDDLKTSDILSGELWIYYLSIGGLASEPEVQAYLNGTATLPPWQRALLEHAYKEMILYP